MKTTLYVAERVRTLDAARPLAQAVAVRGDKVLAVGSRKEVLAAVGPEAQVVDLGSATLVLGLVDAHAHISGLGFSLTTARLEGSSSVEEVVRRLRWRRVRVRSGTPTWSRALTRGGCW